MWDIWLWTFQPERSDDDESYANTIGYDRSVEPWWGARVKIAKWLEVNPEDVIRKPYRNPRSVLNTALFQNLDPAETDSCSFWVAQCNGSCSDYGVYGDFNDDG